MRTYGDLRRLLALLEREWDVMSYKGSGKGETQTLLITFRHKPKEESDES